MNKKLLTALWVGLFILCAACGFIPEGSVPRWLLTAVSLLFFLPPALLLTKADREKDRRTLALIRNLAALSLLLTLILLVLNFLSVLHSELLGDVLYSMLIIVSSPMVCSGYWAVSLFLWACLMTAAIRFLKKH